MMPTKSDRPTMPPSFDVEQYAKDSDARIAKAAPVASPPAEEEAVTPQTPQSEMRLLTRPKMGAVLTNDAWARSMTGAPVVCITPAQLKRLPLDHRAGFLLSLMDGTVDLETLVEIAGMPREDALRIARDLFDSGVVDFR